MLGLFNKKEHQDTSRWRFAMANLTAVDQGLSPCILYDDGTERFVRFGLWPQEGCPVLVFEDPQWNYPVETEGQAWQPVYRHYLRFVGLNAAVSGGADKDVFLEDLDLAFRASGREVFITIRSGEFARRLLGSMMSADYMLLLDNKKNSVMEIPLNIPSDTIEFLGMLMVS